MCHVVSASLPTKVRARAESSDTQENILQQSKHEKKVNICVTLWDDRNFSPWELCEGNAGFRQDSKSWTHTHTHTHTHTQSKGERGRNLLVYKHASHPPFCGGNMQILHNYT